MKIALLGATGVTGQMVLRQSLEKNFFVRAIVRNPASIKTKDDKLEVVKGDIFSASSLTQYFQGCDAVVSCLGHGTTLTNVTIYSESIKSIVEAVRAASVGKFVTITSWETKHDPADHSFEIPDFLLEVMRDMAKMEDYLFDNAKDIKFVIVRPAHLISDPVTDKEILTDEGKNYVKGASLRINRADVARFMLSCVEEDKHVQKVVAIGVKD